MAFSDVASTKATYIACKREIVEATPLIPDSYIPYKTRDGEILQAPLFTGNIQGLYARNTESVAGNKENTATLSADMDFDMIGYILHQTCGSYSVINNGDGTYTHIFEEGLNYQTYTWDFSKVKSLVRFAGTFGESFNLSTSADDVLINVDWTLRARKGFEMARLSGATLVGAPATINIDISNGTKTDMLKVGDLITIGLGTLNEENTVVISIVDDDTITANCVNTHSQGDIIVIRPTTSPSYTAGARVASYNKFGNTFKIADVVANFPLASSICIDSFNFTLEHDLRSLFCKGGRDAEFIVPIDTAMNTTFSKIFTKQDYDNFKEFYFYDQGRAFELYTQGNVIGTGTEPESLRIWFYDARINECADPIPGSSDIIMGNYAIEAVHDRVSGKLYTITLVNTKPSYV
jgi:hypothetical protein